MEKIRVEISLPTDLVTEILARLPVKSLIRFRSVCKSWCESLKSPEFVSLHRKFNQQRGKGHVFISRNMDEDGRKLLTYHSNDAALRVIAPALEVPNPVIREMIPCHSAGIVCLIDTSPCTYLCNLATRELRKIPNCGLGGEPHGYGLGYDPVTDDCKVVMVHRTVDHVDFGNLGRRYGRVGKYHCRYEAEIYKLSTNSWTGLQVAGPLRGRLYSHLAVSFKGSWHWCAENQIVSLDIRTEVFQQMDYPHFVAKRYMRSIPDVLEDSFALISSFLYVPRKGTCKDIYYEVWLMKEYGVTDSWEKKYLIGPLRGIDWPLSTWRREKRGGGVHGEEQVLLFEAASGRLVSSLLLDGNSRVLPADDYDVNEYISAIQKYDVVGYSYLLHPQPLRPHLSFLSYKESLISFGGEGNQTYT